MMGLFAEIVDFLVPAHFTEGEGGLKLLTFATLIDASVERVRQGLNQRFPSRAGDSGLALIGQDRLILRGRTETAPHYAARLKRWRGPRAHRTRGTAYALLEQVCEYFGTNTIGRVYTIRGRVYERAAGVESWTQGSAFDWDGAPVLPNWGRFWVSLALAESGIALQTDSFGDEGTVGLSGFTSSDALAMRGLVSGRHPWKPAGVRAEWLIIAEDFTFAAPDGTWGHWSRASGSAQVQTRESTWRFVSLNPQLNNRYGGNAESFTSPHLIEEVTLTTGDVESFPLSATLPNGSTYAGNTVSFPLDVLLIDDGDAI